MKLFLAGLCFAALLLITGCQSNTKGTDGQSASALQDTTSSSLNPHHATGFRVTDGNGYHLLDIQDPQHEEGTSYHFALVPRGTKPEGIPADYTVIETPVRSVICMTALQLSNFITLEALDRVIGITSSRFLFNKEMKQRLKEGTTKKIGMEGNFDAEVIIQANPDLILISPFKRGGYDSLKELGIPLLPHLGYKEMTPLGQAEWIKCMGLLVGLESE
ncbi:MAG: iron ABC transporter substrate-binding protein, partial [Macellibacteroides fermentans]